MSSHPPIFFYLLVPGIQVQKLLPAGHLNQALDMCGSLLKQLGQAPGRLGLGGLEGFHITGVVPGAQFPTAVTRGGPRR